jgi:cytochrome P450
MIKRLFDRFPDLELAHTPTRRNSFVLRGLASLPVRNGQY